MINGTIPISGHAVLMLRKHITTRELIATKVCAELRKERAGSLSSIKALIGWDVDTSRLEYQAAIDYATSRFSADAFTVTLHGKSLEDLDESITLTKHSVVQFIVTTQAAEPVEAAV